MNAEIDLLADENGVNINTLSKGALETWTINFLQTRVATENQDNLISKYGLVGSEMCIRDSSCYVTKEK